MANICPFIKTTSTVYNIKYQFKAFIKQCYELNTTFNPIGIRSPAGLYCYSNFILLWLFNTYNIAFAGCFLYPM